MDSGRVKAAELRHFYFQEKLTLKQIGERYGVTKQAVHLWFLNAGIERRPRGFEKRNVDPEVVRSLIVNERLSHHQIAKKLNTYIDRVRTAAIESGAWKPGQKVHRCRKFPEINTLNVGESLDLSVGKTTQERHLQFYAIAKKLGIKLKTKTINETHIRVTRVK